MGHRDGTPRRFPAAAAGRGGGRRPAPAAISTGWETARGRRGPTRRGSSAPAFLRFLMLGGEEGCRPHEKGVRISGAWITGVLDLEACRVFRDIGLNDCHFEATPILRAAIINRLFLDGSSLPGLQAERLEARGGVYLRGAQVAGEVSLAQSRLGGNLECDGATIASPAACARCRRPGGAQCSAAGRDIRGGINLSGRAARGRSRLRRGRRHRAPESVAIDADEIESGGSVLLRSARDRGRGPADRLREIGGDLDCHRRGARQSRRRSRSTSSRAIDRRAPSSCAGSPGRRRAGHDRRLDRHHP